MRLLGAVGERVQRYAGGTIALVTHGGVLDVLYRHAHGLAWDAPRLHQMLNASVNELGLFYAGRIFSKGGAFVQGTYDGVAGRWAIDNVDVRAADSFTLFGAPLVAGLNINNSPTVQDEAQMPFGGTKSSGIGRFGGAAGIAEFTDLRWISISTQHRHYPI